jgi:FixJ family two-component response regulator
MKTRTLIHIVSIDSAQRGRIARLVFDAGHHAEIYSSADELVSSAPTNGIGLVDAGADGRYLNVVFDSMSNADYWLPLVAFSDRPRVPDVVHAIRSGAIDYVNVPRTVAEIALFIDQVIPDADAQRDRRRAFAEARAKIACLTCREKQVLNHIALGHTNKMTARTLEISPRTVEIHRMKMMAKLGVTSIAEALRFSIIIEHNLAA